MRGPRRWQGFTLLEVMIVMALVAILASMAIPLRIGHNTQKQIVESLELLEPYKATIEGYYRRHNGDFPDDNEEAGIPAPDKIIGSYIKKTELRDGVMHMHLGRKIQGKLQDKIISIRPLYVKDSVQSPISWVCGFDELPNGMAAAGRNLTDTAKIYLPGRCR